MNALLKKLSSYANGRNILIGILITFVFNLVIFPMGGNKISELSPDALGPLDLEFSYSPEKAYMMVESYGEEGRHIYSLSALIADTLYPITYSITYALILLLMLPKAFPSSPKLKYLALLPFIIGVVDLFENTGIVSMLRSFPIKSSELAMVTSFCTSTKWILVGSLFGIILLAGIIIILQRFQHRTDEANSLGS